MSIFAILDRESEIQVYDKTRLSASKSYAIKSVGELNELTISPELTASAIDCFNSDLSERYLDWSYSNVSIDVGTENDDVIFNEGNSDVTTTLTSGTYTLQQYATHVASKMTAAGTQAYTASVSNNKITISAAASFEFSETSSVATQAFLKLGVSNTSHTGSIVEYGNKIVTVYVSNGNESDTKYFYLKCYSVLGDKLFSQDGDLIAQEPDIMKWVPDGRSSFKNVYRRSQGLIMAWLDQNGYVNAYGDKYTKNDIIDVAEVKQWSIFMSLRLIFQGMSNAVDDIFDRKSKQYEMLEEAARQRVILRIDTDKDGVVDNSEGLGIHSGSLFRR